MGFFKSGFTITDLKAFGNIPELRDIFTMRIITGAITSVRALHGEFHRGKTAVNHGDPAVTENIFSL